MKKILVLLASVLVFAGNAFAGGPAVTIQFCTTSSFPCAQVPGDPVVGTRFLATGNGDLDTNFLEVVTSFDGVNFETRTGERIQAALNSSSTYVGGGFAFAWTVLGSMEYIPHICVRVRDTAGNIAQAGTTALACGTARTAGTKRMANQIKKHRQAISKLEKLIQKKSNK